MSQLLALQHIEKGAKRLPPRHDRDGLDLSTPLVCPEDTLTIQSEKDSCDINFILTRYAKTGEIPVFQYGKEGVSGNFLNVPSFEEAQNLIAAADQYFDRLPGNIRKRFNNNPASFLDFMSDEENNEEAVRLGLRQKPPEPAPATPPPAAPTAPTPPAPPAPPTGSGTPPAA